MLFRSCDVGSDVGSDDKVVMSVAVSVVMMRCIMKEEDGEC